VRWESGRAQLATQRRAAAVEVVAVVQTVGGSSPLAVLVSGGRQLHEGRSRSQRLCGHRWRQHAF
jgi:hypothetical protein